MQTAPIAVSVPLSPGGGMPTTLPEREGGPDDFARLLAEEGGTDRGAIAESPPDQADSTEVGGFLAIGQILLPFTEARAGAGLNLGLPTDAPEPTANLLPQDGSAVTPGGIALADAPNLAMVGLATVGLAAVGLATVDDAQSPATTAADPVGQDSEAQPEAPLPWQKASPATPNLAEGSDPETAPRNKGLPADPVLPGAEATLDPHGTARTDREADTTGAQQPVPDAGGVRHPVSQVAQTPGTPGETMPTETPLAEGSLSTAAVIWVGGKPMPTTVPGLGLWQTLHGIEPQDADLPLPRSASLGVAIDPRPVTLGGTQPAPPPTEAPTEPSTDLAFFDEVALPVDAADPQAGTVAGLPLGGSSAIPASGSLQAWGLASLPPASLTQLAAQIGASLAQHGNGVTEFTLSPKELGTVRISLQPEAPNSDRMVVLLSFDRPETLELFRRHADQLSAALDAAGYGGSSLGFAQFAKGDEAEANRSSPTSSGQSFGSGSGHSFGQNSGQNSGQNLGPGSGQGFGHGSGRGQADDQAARHRAEAPPPPPRATNGSLDLRL